MLQYRTNDPIQAPLLATLNCDLSLLDHDPILGDPEQLRSDLTLAMAVQRQMLPRNTKQLTSIRYSGTTIPARGIGGDYYDFLDLGADSVGVVVADVAGKGVAAALLMAHLQAAIRCESARGFHDLSAMLQRVNEHFMATTLPAQYATLFFGRYDDRTHRPEYISCGHQSAILLRTDGSFERLQPTALPIGMIGAWKGDVETIELRPGDRLFVFSDGVIEAGLDRGCEFGEAGLLSVAAMDAPREIELTVKRIMHAACSYAAHGLVDDMTVVGVRAV